MTGGQTNRPSIVCSIVRCAKLHAKVVLSVMKFFYLFYHVYYVIALECLVKALGAALSILHNNVQNWRFAVKSTVGGVGANKN